MPEITSINADVSGGNAGIVGAKEVHVGSQTFISNFYGAAPQVEPTKTVGPLPKSPYPGLSYFGPLDADRFFGREQAIQALVTAVTKRSFTAVVGASGSGKSSVVLAGLAPRLETQGGWRSTYFRIGTEPDKNPFAALARALSPMLGDGDVVDRMTRAQKLANSLATGEISLVYVVGQCCAANPGKRILLIADQFEEVFTLVSDDGVRNRFIDALIAAFQDAAQGAAPDVCLVLTLRADFVSQAINYRPLADKLKDRVEYLGAMTRGELREAIVEPAKALGVEFEPGLANTILDDVEKRPGSLPLLQFALREMWGRLNPPEITLADYKDIGGVEGALAQRAQLIFNSATRNGKDKELVTVFRRLFTRLVNLGEGAEDTRRIVSREELGPDAWKLAQKLANEDNRLVVTAGTVPGRETAEVIHEALIRNWPTLVEWVDLDREFQSWLRRLRPRLDDWRTSPTDAGTLLRGAPLATAENWVANRGDEINDEEKAFVSESTEFRKRELLRDEEDLKQKHAGLVAVAREQAAKIFFDLRGQTVRICIITLMIMFVCQLVRSYLLATEYDWSSLTASEFYSGKVARSNLFVEHISLTTLIYAVYIAAITGLSTLISVMKYYTSSDLWTDPRKLAYYAGKQNSIEFRLDEKTNNRWSDIKYYHLYIDPIFISIIISYIINMLPFDQLLGIDKSITYAFSVYKIPWLQPVIYTVCLAFLTHRQVATQRPRRALDGLIVGTMIGIGEVLQILFGIGQSMEAAYPAAHLIVFSVVLVFSSSFSGFAIGCYFPATAGSAFARARLALDQCSALTIRTETQSA